MIRLRQNLGCNDMKLEFRGFRERYNRMKKKLAAYRLKKRTHEFRNLVMSSETDMKKLAEIVASCKADGEMMNELLSKPTVYDITLERMLLMLKAKWAAGEDVSDHIYSLLQGFDVLYHTDHRTHRTDLLVFVKSLILDDATRLNTLKEVSFCMVSVGKNAELAARDLLYYALVANAKTRADALEALREEICFIDPDFPQDAEVPQDVLFSAMDAMPTPVAQDVRRDTVAFVQGILNSADFQEEMARNSPKYESTISSLAYFMDRVNSIMNRTPATSNTADST